ncbi:MAG: hypothetical protein GX159_03760, partial [Flavobacteriaceae bacterium]|nr:hypothetical protein [Flavobacteriaceae bacterium]
MRKIYFCSLMCFLALFFVQSWSSTAFGQISLTTDQQLEAERALMESNNPVNFTNPFGLDGVSDAACENALPITSGNIVNEPLVCGTEDLLNATNVTVFCSSLGTFGPNYSSGIEATYTYTPSEDGSVTITVNNQSWAAIMVYEGCPTEGNCVAAERSSGTTRTVTFDATEGVEYFIWIDSWAPPASPCSDGGLMTFSGPEPMGETEPSDLECYTLNHPILNNFNGTYFKWDEGLVSDNTTITGWHFNPYGSTTLSFYFSTGSGAVSSPSGGTSWLVLGPGDVVGPDSNYGGSIGQAVNWQSGADGYLGIRFPCDAPGGTCYGYVHMTTTSGGGYPATVIDYCYDPSGEAVTIPGDIGEPEPSEECSQGIASVSTLPNAYGIDSSEDYRVADDFVVGAGGFIMNKITIDVNNQAVPSNAVINIRANNAGAPGTILHTVTGAPDSSEVVGSAYGDPIHHLTFNLDTPIELDEGIYWIEPTMSGDDYVWLALVDYQSSHGANMQLSNNSGATWLADGDYSMIFTVSGTCGEDGGEDPCSAVDVPYLEDFELAVVPGMPECTTTENIGSGNDWTTATATTGNYGFTGTFLRYSWHNTEDADTWFYTKGINLTAGTTYEISYKYGGTGTTFVESMKVAYGTSAESTAMTTTLADHPTITNNTPLINTVEFTPDADGVYYFGFNAYSEFNKFYLHVDDIQIQEVDGSTEPGDEIDCEDGPGIVKLDDGIIDNGFSGNPASVSEVVFVEKFTPTSYPVTVESVCAAFAMQSGATPSMDYEIVVYDDDGTEGEPGTEIGTMTGLTANDIPVYSGGSQAVWQSADTSSENWQITEGSVYVGVKFSPSTLNHYIAADQSTTTPVGQAYWWNDLDEAWTSVAITWPTYRALMIRPAFSEGTPVEEEDLLIVDLTVPNQVTITATDATSVATVSGSTTTGFYFEDLLSNAGTQAIGTTTYEGTPTLTAASVPTDNSPSLYRGGSSADPGMNIYSYSGTSTTTFTEGEQAFTGEATWNISEALYNALITAPESGNLHFPADDISDVGNTATLIGTYRVILPDGSGEPGYDCSQSVASNNMENGGFIGGDTNQRLAIDINVNTESTFAIDQIKLNLIQDAAPTYINIIIREDVAGIPGDALHTFNNVSIIDSEFVGSNFGFDFYTHTLDISAEDLVLEGGATGAKFWMEVESDADGWESTTAAVTGSAGAFFNNNTGGVWMIGTSEYVYELIGTCTGEEEEPGEGCFVTGTFDQWPSTTYVPSCLGVPEAITTAGWAGEFSKVQVTAGVEYTFSSSVPTDFITIADETQEIAFITGTGSVTWTSPVDQVIRFYVHKD